MRPGLSGAASRIARRATALATHRYQDGVLLANYRYNAHTERLEHAGGRDLRTRFVVLGEGRIVFEGTQEKLEASEDPYISKFAKPLKDQPLPE